MIGDTCMDMVSAKECCVKGIGVTSGYASEQELKKCSDIVVEDTLKAVTIISTL
jgi:phosphoglycolate phosphatase